MATEPSTAEPELARYRLAAAEVLSSRPELPVEDDGPQAALLRQNAEWFCRLRWIVVALLTAVGLAGLAPHWLDWAGLQLTWQWPWCAAGVLAAVNLAYRFLLARMPLTATAARRHLGLQIVIDLLVLTAVVHFAGSLSTYAAFAYLFHVVLSCIFFSARESLAVTALAAGLYLGCLWLEASGLLRSASVVAGASATGSAWLPAASAIGIWSVIWYLVSRLAARLRIRDAELAATNRRLQASSEERMRHMLQTTHQLKAPFAAIHAQTQLLEDGYCGSLPESALAVVRKIAARCGVLSQQIHDMLQLANLRSEAQKPPARQEIDLRALVQAAVERVAPAAAVRGIAVETRIEVDAVYGVEDHLRMLLDNLLTNAVNYSRDGSPVELEVTRTPDGGTAIAVRDHGIGIPADKLPAVFDDYFRTKEAVRHNPSSTGLGLAIVRDVVRVDGLQLDVASRPGWGSRFTLWIPPQPGTVTG